MPGLVRRSSLLLIIALIGIGCGLDELPVVADVEQVAPPSPSPMPLPEPPQGAKRQPDLDVVSPETLEEEEEDEQVVVDGDQRPTAPTADPGELVAFAIAAWGPRGSDTFRYFEGFAKVPPGSVLGYEVVAMQYDFSAQRWRPSTDPNHIRRGVMQTQPRATIQPSYAGEMNADWRVEVDITGFPCVPVDPISDPLDPDHCPVQFGIIFAMALPSSFGSVVQSEPIQQVFGVDGRRIEVDCWWCGCLPGDLLCEARRVWIDEGPPRAARWTHFRAPPVDQLERFRP